MKLNRTRWILVQSLILFVLSFGVCISLDWQNASSAIQAAELTGSNPRAQISVRTDPSSTATLTGIAFPGDRIEILNQVQSSDGYTWYQMQSNRTGIVGWVPGDQVRFFGAAPQPMVVSQPKVISQLIAVPQPIGGVVSQPIAAVQPKVFTLQRTPSLQKNPIDPQASNCAPVYPVPIPVINQGFGQVSDPFNPRQTHFHPGIDFDGSVGDPINSPVCGTVFYVGREQDGNNYEWGYGWHVKIRDSEGRIHLFGHISKAYVKVGQTVTAGQLIAAIGNNGNSTGPHLHYEIRQGADTYQNAVNPMPFLARAAQGNTPQAGTQMMPTEYRSPLRF